MLISNFLGHNINDLLATSPFDQWRIEEHYEIELLEYHYAFPLNGISFRCNKSKIIESIFLDASSDIESAEGQFEVELQSTREQVLNKLGTPSYSRGVRHVQYLGQIGPVDKFSRSGFTIQITYTCDSGRVDKVGYVLE